MFRNALGILAVLIILSPAVLAADPTGSLVHVSGRGLVRIAPDQVVIELTVRTTDDDLIRVRENSDKDAQTILGHAKKHAIDASGFEVSRLDLSLDFNEQLRRQIYEVERDITLRLNDLTKLDALLSDLLQERNLKVVGINFVTSKGRQHEFEARRRAVADAMEKATNLAELNGFQLGDARDIRVISESQDPFITSITPVVGAAEPRVPRQVERISDKVATDPKISSVRLVAFQPPKEEVKANGIPFALGMIEISAYVEIDFALEK